MKTKSYEDKQKNKQYEREVKLANARRKSSIKGDVDVMAMASSANRNADGIGANVLAGGASKDSKNSSTSIVFRADVVRATGIKYHMHRGSGTNSSANELWRTERHMDPALTQQIIYFARAYDLRAATITHRLTFCRPTAFVSTPRVYEKICDKLRGAFNLMPNTLWIRDFCNWLREVQMTHLRNRQIGGTGLYPFAYSTANAFTRTLRRATGLDMADALISGEKLLFLYVRSSHIVAFFNYLSSFSS